MSLPPELLFIIGIFLFIMMLSKLTETKVIVSQRTINDINRMINEHPIFIVSKSYCPYCKATLTTLFDELKVPKSKVYIIEIDLMENGRILQEALRQINGQRTVPHIYINKHFVGGNSDLQKMKKSGDIMPLLERALA